MNREELKAQLGEANRRFARAVLKRETKATIAARRLERETALLRYQLALENSGYLEKEPSNWRTTVPTTEYMDSIPIGSKISDAYEQFGLVSRD